MSSIDDENANNILFNFPPLEDSSDSSASASTTSSMEDEEIFPDATIMQINDLEVKFPGHASTEQSQILVSVTDALLRNKNLMIDCADDEERRLAMIVGILAVQSNIPVAQAVDPDDENAPKKLFARQAKMARKVFFAIKSRKETGEVINCLRQLKNTGYLEDLKLAVFFDPTDHCHCEGNGWECRPPPPPSQESFKFVDEDGTVHSVETLIGAATRGRFCPKLFSKSLMDSANFVICPQHVLASSFLRERNGVNAPGTGDIIIFDDGNQIEKVCEDAASISISTFQMQRASRDLWNITHRIQNEPMPQGIPEAINRLSRLSDILRDMSNIINGQRPTSDQDLFAVLRREFESLDEVNSYYSNFMRYLDFSESGSFDAGARENHPYRRRLYPETVTNTVKLLTAVKYFYVHNGLGVAGNCPYFTLKLRVIPPSGNEEEKVVFNIFCVKPSLIFQEMTQLASTVLIASRSLPPESILKKQLGSQNFSLPVRILEQNVASTFFAYCGNGPNGAQFELEYKSQHRETVHRELGEALLQISCVVPNGIIVFFPCRRAIADRVKNWKDGTNRSVSVWNLLEQTKHIFNELDFDNPGDAKVEIEKFRKLCTQPERGRNGAIMLALHRGNVNELMDFHQGEVRTIINLGIPYDSWVSFKIEAKRNYFDYLEPHLPEQGRKPATRSFYDWYNSEAFQFVNDKFAHCVRRDQKWVAVLVLDTRMVLKERYFPLLIPSWIQNSLKPRYNDFNVLMSHLQNFVEENQ